MRIFAFGSSIVSSYWNGAATYYRGCYKYLARLGHEVTFAEPDAYNRQQHRDKDNFSYVDSIVYQPSIDLDRMLALASQFDVVVKHSGIGVDDETLERRMLELKEYSAVTFWDVDAPATLARMNSNPDDAFLKLLPGYDAVLSYGGGSACRNGYLSAGAASYFSIYNGLDPETHYSVAPDPTLACDIAFLGNRLPDREARVDDLFLRAAELAPKSRFLIGGEGWTDKAMPPNVRYIGHVPTREHNLVNCSAGMVININRASMAKSGFSPPTRIFEVAGAGACLLCDEWPGIEDCFTPGVELLVVRSAEDVAAALTAYDHTARLGLGQALHARALTDHTYAQRAKQAEQALQYCLSARNRAQRGRAEEPAAI